MDIGIIDYGMGNLRSVQKGFEKIGAGAAIISTPEALDRCHGIVLPGVGAFKNCIQNLDRLRLIDPVIKSIKQGKPFLGICLGLQALFTESHEFGITPGLDVIKGRVVRFDTAESQRLKVPHIGWNTVSITTPDPALEGIPDRAYFYFVHSYYVVPEDTGVIATTTCYGTDFVSGIRKDNIFACQFHPEKSQKNGLRLLKNFADEARKS